MARRGALFVAALAALAVLAASTSPSSSSLSSSSSAIALGSYVHAPWWWRAPACATHEALAAFRSYKYSAEVEYYASSSCKSKNQCYKLTLYWTPDDTLRLLHMAVSLDTRGGPVGMVGVGFTSNVTAGVARMYPAAAVIAWQNDSASDIAPYLMTRHHQPSEPAAMELTHVMMDFSDKVKTFSFTRPYNCTDARVPNVLGDVNVIFAVSEAPGYSYHDHGRGAALINFRSAYRYSAELDYYSVSECKAKGCYPFTLSWTPDEDAQLLHVRITVNTRGGNMGMMALGFSEAADGGMPKMIPATAVIAYRNGTQLICKPYTLEKREAPTREAAMELTNVECNFTDDIKTLSFTRPYKTADKNVVDTVGNVNVIFAVREADGLHYHSHGRGGAIIDFQKNEVKQSSLSVKLAVHIFGMFIGWLVLLPIGMGIARFGKSHEPLWFHAHIGVQTSALIFVLVAFAMAIALAYDRPVEGIFGAHRALGISAVCLLVLQPLNGWLRPAKSSPNRAYWNVLHHMLGRAAYLMAGVNVYFGLRVYNAAPSYFVAFYSIAGAILGVLFALDVVHYTRATGPYRLKEYQQL